METPKVIRNLKNMCESIVSNKAAGLYDGAYKVVKGAIALKEGREVL